MALETKLLDSGTIVTIPIKSPVAVCENFFPLCKKVFPYIGHQFYSIACGVKSKLIVEQNGHSYFRFNCSKVTINMIPLDVLMSKHHAKKVLFLIHQSNIIVRNMLSEACGWI